MLDELGIRQFAYDYRDEHIPDFRREIRVLAEHGIRLRAVWLWVEPSGGTVLNASNLEVLRILEETGTQTELWMGIPETVFQGLDDGGSLQRAVGIVREVLERAEGMGCNVALYNHGGWFGEPENQIRIIREIGSEQVGIVYNFHHGHHQVDRFGSLFSEMMPYLTAVNINGMKVEGPKIITLGEGDRELEMLRIIRDAGYSGPIGILGHTEGEDIRIVLERNLKGLEGLKSEL